VAAVLLCKLLSSQNPETEPRLKETVAKGFSAVLRLIGFDARAIALRLISGDPKDAGSSK